jgi:succinoglycan biosynthesis transport protein ExoP
MFEAPRQFRSAVVAPGNFAVGMAPLSQLDFQKIWSLIWRGRATILYTMLAAFALAVMFIVFSPHEYTAVTQILIDPTDLRAVGNDTSPPAQASDAVLLQVESQVQILTSDAVLRRVVNSEGLDHDPEFARGPSLLSVLIGKDAIPGGSALAALNELKRRVAVKRADRTFVVAINVTSRDPMKAVRLANAVAQAFLDEQTDVRAAAARQVSQSLSARLKELKDRVRDSEEKAEAYKARNNLVATNGQLVTEQQLTELNNQLGAARAHTAEAKARLDQIEQVQHKKDETGAFPEAIQSPTITALRSQYAEIVRREAEQKTTLGDLHPAVLEIEAQAERLRGVIDTEVNRVALSARAEYESAKASEQTLADNLDTLKHSAIASNEAMVGLRELDRDVQANRSVYEAFLVRARETGEQEQLDTKNIRVLAKANLPQRRSSPPPSLLVAMAALMLGAAAGTGIVLVRPPAEDGAARIIAGDAWRKVIGIATMGLWPATASPAIPVLAILPGADVSFGLSAVEDPTSSFGKQIRKVYDEVRASHIAPGNPSVLVVAADDEDDSATVALALAAVGAATESVLLIDADLKRRTLLAIDAEPGDAGLVDVAVGRRQLADVITRDRDTNINLAAFIAPASRRDRRIDDADVKRAFNETKRFDMVIVAAMDVSGDPGIRFFAGLVDHIVLVFRTDEHNDDIIEQFMSRLGLDPRKVRGVVLTGGGTA